jgi:hypothetical protein
LGADGSFGCDDGTEAACEDGTSPTHQSADGAPMCVVAPEAEGECGQGGSECQTIEWTCQEALEPGAPATTCEGEGGADPGSEGEAA